MKKQTIEKFLALASLSLFVVVAVIAPFFFDNGLASRFELPRVLILWVAVGALLWLSVMRQQLRGPDGQYLRMLDKHGVILLLWVTVVGFSTFLSTNLLSSVFGLHGRLIGGALSSLALVLLALAARWHFALGKDRRILYTLVAVLGVVQAGLGILQLLGMDWLGVTNGATVAIGTLGSVASFGWMGLITFWTALFLGLSQRGVAWRLGWMGAALLGLWSLGSAYSIELWMVFIFSLVLGSVILWRRFRTDKQDWKWLLGGAGAVLLLVLAMSAPLIPGAKLPEQKQILPLDMGWYVSAGVARDFPLLGSGPETFGSSMLFAKTVEFNLGEGWNYNNIVSSNEFLTQLANLGYLGLLAFLVLLVWVGREILRAVRHANTPKRWEDLTPIILWWGGTVAYWLFFGLDYVSAIYFWVSTGMLLIEAPREGLMAEKIPAKPLTANEKQSLGFLAIGGVITLMVIMTFGVRWLQSDRAFYAQARASQDDSLKAYEQSKKAQELLPWVDYYQTAYAYRSLDLISARQQELGDSPTEEQQQQFSKYAQQRIDEARAAVDQAVKLSPERSENWGAKAEVALAASGGQEADDAISNYEQALARDPLSARYAFILGGVYENQQNQDAALSYYRRATDAKPDWWVSRYKLALLQEASKQYATALAQMEAVTTLMERDSTADEATRSQVAEDLERIKAAAEVQESESAEENSAEVETPVVEAEAS